MYVVFTHVNAQYMCTPYPQHQLITNIHETCYIWTEHEWTLSFLIIHTHKNTVNSHLHGINDVLYILLR